MFNAIVRFFCQKEIVRRIDDTFSPYRRNLCHGYVTH